MSSPSRIAHFSFYIYFSISLHLLSSRVITSGYWAHTTFLSFRLYRYRVPLSILRQKACSLYCSVLLIFSRVIHRDKILLDFDTLFDHFLYLFFDFHLFRSLVNCISFTTFLWASKITAFLVEIFPSSSSIFALFYRQFRSSRVHFFIPSLLALRATVSFTTCTYIQ